MAEVLHNACVIISMRKLLGDPEWLPRPIMEIIRDNNGYPGERNKELEKYAPVYVWTMTKVDELEGGVIMLSNDKQKATFTPETRAIVSYRLNATRGHTICVPLRTLFQFKKEIIMAATRKDDGIYALPHDR